MGIEIAATRQILLHANAGDIIFAFGNFVVGGNFIFFWVFLKGNPVDFFKGVKKGVPLNKHALIFSIQLRSTAFLQNSLLAPYDWTIPHCETDGKKTHHCRLSDLKGER